VTGLSLQQDEVAGKRLELLREIVPDLGQLAIMVDVGLPDAIVEMRTVQTLARTLGFDVSTLEIRLVSLGVVEIESSAGHAERLITRSMDRAGRG
jgi:ABC-type uncharacterized transport system substrate-binding protein